MSEEQVKADGEVYGVGILVTTGEGFSGVYGPGTLEKCLAYTPSPEYLDSLGIGPANPAWPLYVCRLDPEQPPEPKYIWRQSEWQEVTEADHKAAEDEESRRRADEEGVMLTSCGTPRCAVRLRIPLLPSAECARQIAHVVVPFLGAEIKTGLKRTMAQAIIECLNMQECYPKASDEDVEIALSVGLVSVDFSKDYIAKFE